MKSDLIKKLEASNTKKKNFFYSLFGYSAASTIALPTTMTLLALGSLILMGAFLFNPVFAFALAAVILPLMAAAILLQLGVPLLNAILFSKFRNKVDKARAGLKEKIEKADDANLNLDELATLIKKTNRKHS